jgi:hypothetical protein
MQVLRWLIVAVILINMGFVQAQENAYELPALQSGELVEGRFEENIISQLYGFYATEGDVLSIRMSQEAETELDPFLVLLDSEGAVLAYDDDSGEPDLAALIENFVVEEDGAYFVLATSEALDYLNGNVAEITETQDYILSVSGQTTPESVENPTTIELDLNPLSIGASVQGESSEETPTALFIFEGTAGSTVTLSVETDGFFSVVYLFAPDGSRIAVDPSFISMELEETGVYLVLVGDWYFQTAIDQNGEFEGGVFSLNLEN